MYPITFASEIKGLCQIRSAERLKKCFSNLLSGQRRSSNVIIGDSEATFMLGELGQSKSIEYLIRKSGNEGGLSEVLDCALLTYLS